MMVKRKELQCELGKITVEEFHDGYRMHIAVIAERNVDPIADEYGCAYREVGIEVKGEKREIRFSISDFAVTELVSRGVLGPNTGVIQALKILAKEAWARKNDLDPYWGAQAYVWNQSGNATNPFTDPIGGYEFKFTKGQNGPMPESFE